jgi:hypothetical protein
MKPNLSGVGAVFAVSLVLATFAATGVSVADTATDLKCRGCVGKKDLGKKAVRAKNIKRGSVRADHIKPGSLNADHIGLSQISEKHLSDAAKPAGVAAVENGSVSQIVGEDIIETVTLSAPGRGTIVVTGSLSISLASNSSVQCAITPESKIGTQFAGASSGLASQSIPISTTRAFPVTAAGDTSINLICKMSLGAGNSAQPSLTALFVPATY